MPLQDPGSAATAQRCKETLHQGKGRLSLCPTSQVGWVLAQPSTVPGTQQLPGVTRKGMTTPSTSTNANFTSLHLFPT